MRGYCAAFPACWPYGVHWTAVTTGVTPFIIAEFIVMFLMVLIPKRVTVSARWFY